MQTTSNTINSSDILKPSKEKEKEGEGKKCEQNHENVNEMFEDLALPNDNDWKKALSSMAVNSISKDGEHEEFIIWELAVFPTPWFEAIYSFLVNTNFFNWDQKWIGSWQKSSSTRVTCHPAF